MTRTFRVSALPALAVIAAALAVGTPAATNLSTVTGFGATRTAWRSNHPGNAIPGAPARAVLLNFGGGRLLNVEVDATTRIGEREATRIAFLMAPRDARLVMSIKRRACVQLEFRSRALAHVLGRYGMLAELQSASDYVYTPSNVTTITFNVVSVGDRSVPC